MLAFLVPMWVFVLFRAAQQALMLPLEPVLKSTGRRDENAAFISTDMLT